MAALAVLLVRSTDDPDRAVAAVRAAHAAAAAFPASKPALVLDDEGVRVGAKGVAEVLSGGGRPNVKAMLAAFVAAGGRVLVSRDAWNERGYAADALVDGAALVDADALAQLAASGYAIASF